MEFIKKNIKYLFIFMFSFVCMSFLLTLFDGDVLWNYGFSYAINRGEIPYLDFNMILTPFYSFLMSIPLFINNNILVFYISNSLLITCIFYLLDKMFSYKSFVFLILLVFPIPCVVFPSYNLLLVFFLILLIYLEKNNKNDYLIGFIIGLSILTKQSVGVFLIIPSIYYYRKDMKKLLKRLIGLIVPCFIFLIYLLVTKSLFRFIDLCFLGLFDFTGNNSNIGFSMFIGIILIVLSILLFFKNKKNINYLYVLMFSSIMIPLFDYPHIEYFLFIFVTLFINNISINKKSLILNCSLFSICFSIIFFAFTININKINYPNHYNNFNFRLLLNNNNEFVVRDKVNKYIGENKDKRIVMISSDAYFYKITNNLDIDIFDLNNKGNFGYDGTNKIKKEIDKLSKNTIVIIDEVEAYSDDASFSLQFNREVSKYMISVCKKVKSIDGYGVYIKK